MLFSIIINSIPPANTIKDPDTPTQHVGSHNPFTGKYECHSWGVCLCVTVEEQRDAATGECDLMVFSKDHSDPCWTGQPLGL